MRKTYYVDMDGVIANFHKEPYNRANALSETWIANIEPFTENIATIKALIANKQNVYILSKAANNDAKNGKLTWLAKYLPEINRRHIIIIVGNGKKVDYMKTKTGTLIDDDMKNIKPWIKAGHKAIFLETKGASIEI